MENQSDDQVNLTEKAKDGNVEQQYFDLSPARFVDDSMFVLIVC